MVDRCRSVKIVQRSRCDASRRFHVGWWFDIQLLSPNTHDSKSTTKDNADPMTRTGLMGNDLTHPT